MNIEALKQLNEEYTNELCDLAVQLITFEDNEAFEEAEGLKQRILVHMDNASIAFSNIGGIPIDVVKTTFNNNYNDLIVYIRNNKSKLI